MEQSMRSLGRFHADQESGSLAFAHLPACVLCVCLYVCVCVCVCLDIGMPWTVSRLYYTSHYICVCMLQGGSFI